MSNLVLYRKYRPQTFSEIVGQEHVVKTLKNAIASDTISHAYLFSGPRGSGKTTIARLLAKAVNCHDRKKGESEPCNECSSCQEVREGRSLDIIEIDAASQGGIEGIRELREGIKFSPNKEKYKVFIIDESHQLTKDAANALLKTLEEPPPHAIFILATTEIHKMIPTIISRSQRFDFRKLTLDEIVKRLKHISKEEKADVDDSVLRLIALNSGGSIRDAESLLDQVLAFRGVLKKEATVKEVQDLLGIADNAVLAKFVSFLSEKKGKEAINFLQEVFDKGYDPQQFSKALIDYLRKILIFKIDPDSLDSLIVGLTKEEQGTLKELSGKLEGKDLNKLLELFLEAENKMKYASIPQLPLELAIVEITKKEE